MQEEEVNFTVVSGAQEERWVLQVLEALKKLIIIYYPGCETVCVSVNQSS